MTQPTSYQVVVGTTPVQLVGTFDPTRQLAFLARNTHASASVYVGDSTVTTATGFAVKAGELLSGGLVATDGAAALYAVSASSVTVTVLTRPFVTGATSLAAWKSGRETPFTIIPVPASSGGGGGAVTSVFGRTGDVVGSPTDVGADALGAAASAQAAAIAASQPVDSDLTAIAALSTTAFGRAFLTSVDAAGVRTTLALGSAALSATSAFDAAGAAATAQAAAIAASQPVDSDLTAIAALATTAFGRSVLTQADAAAIRTLLALGTAATTAASAYEVAGAAAAAQAASQPVDSDLTSIAALTTTAFGRALLTQADAAATKTVLVLVKADVGLSLVDNTADASKPVSTAQQTALNLKADLAGPSFTGTVNMAAGLILGGALQSVGATSLGGGIESRSGVFGLTYIATEYNHVCATYDARSTRGTGNGIFSHSLSGDALFCLRGGGSTDSAFADCGKIQWTATQDFSGTASGSSCGIYTNPNNTLGGVLGLLVDQDGSVFVTTNLSIGATMLISSLGVVTGMAGWTMGTYAGGPAAFLRRANGTAGSETKVLSGQSMGGFNWQGWNDTSGGYLAGAAVTALADQDFTTAGFRGSRLAFNTAPNSVVGGPLTRMIIDNAGKLYIGSTTGAATNIDQSGNTALGGTLAVVGNVGFNGKTAQALTGIAAPTATLSRTALADPAYTTTGGTGTTAGAFDTNTHRDAIITAVFNNTKTLAALITDLRANGVVG